jgi:chromate transporter
MAPLGEIARLFLFLGVTAFGGPAAHIAMMHEHVVRRRRWLTDGEFADLLAAVNLIPGPNSTELAIHIGRRMGGWAGFAVAGVTFIMPAALIVAALAAAYVKYGSAPDARAVMTGVAPVIIAVVGHAAYQLATTTLKRPAQWLVAAGALALAIAGVNEIAILVAAGIVMLAAGRHRVATAAIAAASGVSAYAAAAAVPVSLVKLTLFFLKVGSVLFGSGYVLVAFLRADLVDRWGWLTEQQLLDAVAVGQFTPGPVFTTATFIGYLLGGGAGAALATIAIFLPAFVFVALTHGTIPRLRVSKTMSAFLDGVVAASLALMIAVALALARTALTTPLWTAVAVVALLLLVRWRVNSAWLVLAGGAIGLLVRHGFFTLLQ